MKAGAFGVAAMPGAVPAGDVATVGLVATQVFILGDTTFTGTDGFEAFHAVGMGFTKAAATVLADVLSGTVATPESAAKLTRCPGHRPVAPFPHGNRVAARERGQSAAIQAQAPGPLPVARVPTAVQLVLSMIVTRPSPFEGTAT